MDQTIPLEAALEHYGAAAIRGVEAGRLQEQQRIYQILKAHNQYEALTILKMHPKRER